MSKVICDICGTVYPDTADSCPICGYVQYPDLELTEEDLLMDEPLITRNKGGRYVETPSKRKNKEIFDYDEVNPEEDEEEDYDSDDEEEEEEDAPKSSVGLVIVLVIVIMLLLAAVGFVFTKFFLPSLMGARETAPTTEATVATAPSTEATTEPTVPCTDLILNEAPKALTKEGQYYLLNVKVFPEDTTDIVMYVSEDDTVCTVTENGRIEATGEGQTTVYITCGKMQINVPITVQYEEETQPPTEETVEETMEETEPTEPETTAPEVVLKLKRDDISLTCGYGVTLELDCDLDPSQVEWTVEHGHIASVDEKGFVLAKSRGTTAVIVRYGDQEIQCIIRCK